MSDEIVYTIDELVKNKPDLYGKKVKAKGELFNYKLGFEGMRSQSLSLTLRGENIQIFTINKPPYINLSLEQAIVDNLGEEVDFEVIVTEGHFSDKYNIQSITLGDTVYSQS